MPFIKEEISKIANPGDTIVDIFSGSGSVGNGLKDNYRIIANDAENYSSVISSSLLNTPPAEDLKKVKKDFQRNFANFFNEKSLESNVLLEETLLENDYVVDLEKLYKSLPTVWDDNASITPEKLRQNSDYNLFQFYYTGTYFGLRQAIEIDTIIMAINLVPDTYRDVLYSSLFYAMKEVVFSKDGHMAQPLSIKKNPERHLKQRKKKVIDYFLFKLDEFIEKSELPKYDHVILNADFLDILSDDLLKYKPKVIYADPPYTDMQYSRYYHILNVAMNYDYPELTKYRGGYTKGLYTEGRNQSGLSQRGKAKAQIAKLLHFSKNNNIKVVLSYAFPEDQVLQAVNRYTITIEELINLAKEIYGDNKVYWSKTSYKHANHRNSSQKKVYEYLIVCGEETQQEIPNHNLRDVKKNISNLIPTSKNDMYNSHLYWSQKSYNVIDELIKGLSKEGDIIFDPFMGSGVTILEAVRKDMKRVGIGCDVNEMPLFISRTLLNDMFKSSSDNIINKFSEDIATLEKSYETLCTHCNNKGTITKVTFDKPSRTSNEDIKIHSISYKCEFCGNSVKKPDSIDYDNMFNLTENINNIIDTPLIINSKIAVGENNRISTIFTPRNFSVLDKIVGLINTYENPNIPKYLLMSVLHLAKITDTHSNSQWPLWIPKINCVEKNIVDLLQKKITRIKKTQTFMQENYFPDSIVENFKNLENNKALLLRKGSQFITQEEVADNSVSLIITDPPYMEQVLYSEYMQLYKPFLGLDYNLEDEIVVSSSPQRNKNKNSYFQLLEEVFAMCSRKLKEEGYMCLFFHDSNLNVWYNLIETLEKNGFKFVSQEHIRKSKTVKNILSPKKSLNGDAVLFFENVKKPLPTYESETELPVIEKSLFDQTKLLINKYGPLSTPELYDKGLMEVLISNGWLKKFSKKYKTLVEFFEDRLIWQKENGKWRLK